jgi:predicted alpha/beta superfamily hydrolase
MRMLRKLAAPCLCAAFGGGWAAHGAAAQEPVPPHETFTIESAVLGETRRINVYTPPDYRTGTARFPVLYMPDGGVREDFPHIAATMDAGIRAGEIRRMLVVGIENTERRRDMTGPTEVEEDRRIAPRVGGSAAFRRFIADELMPEVRRRYRATDETAIIGESLAGLFIVESFFQQPELFTTWIALSPSLWWNREALVRDADPWLKTPWWQRLALPPRWIAPRVLYLSSADEENIAPAAARLAAALRANPTPWLRWQYQPRPELTHATIYRAEAPRVLRELLAPPLSIFTAISAPGRPDWTDTAGIAPLREGTLAHSEPVGVFTLLREEYTYPPAVSGWVKIRLSFRTRDRRVSLALTDNGRGLALAATSPGCLVRVSFLQYAFDGVDRQLFAAMQTGLRVLVERCGSRMDDPARYQRELEAAEADFPAAIRTMRARVSAAFGAHTERCGPPGPDEPPMAGNHHETNPCGP